MSGSSTIKLPVRDAIRPGEGEGEPFHAEESLTYEDGMKPNEIPPEYAAIVRQAVVDEAQGGGVLGYRLMDVKLTLQGVKYT